MHIHRGRHYTVENARLYTLPEQPPPTVGGAKGAALAGKLGDGMIATDADAELLEPFDREGAPGSRATESSRCAGPRTRRTASGVMDHLAG